MVDSLNVSRGKVNDQGISFQRTKPTSAGTEPTFETTPALTFSDASGCDWADAIIAVNPTTRDSPIMPEDDWVNQWSC